MTRLLDSRNGLRGMRDMLRYCAGRIHFFAEQASDAKDGDSALSETESDSSDGKTIEQEPAKIADDIDQARLKDLIEDRNRKNRKLQATEKELARMQAALKAIEDKDKTEKELAEERAKLLEAELEKVRYQARETNNVNQALAAGVLAKYAKHAALDLAEAQAQEGDVDSKGFWVEYKKQNPELFDAKPPINTGGGGSANRINTNSSDILVQLEKELRERRGTMTLAQESSLVGKIAQLRQELKR